MGQRWLDTYEVLERGVAATTGIKPNLDLPTGPKYRLICFDTPSFTTIFEMGRVTGGPHTLSSKPPLVP